MALLRILSCSCFDGGVDGTVMIWAEDVEEAVLSSVLGMSTSSLFDVEDEGSAGGAGSLSVSISTIE